ncbi:Endonuclease/exonuclease/phosphatase [Kockovaella imperatae]|uniref:Endonuclease/exonuclease/phosphatase n=1 Tax=Kockovaella imperatae TaxID=4999 RepID=A0A1Y1U955_9TREE|nr:Endonuclease/exonuclease/phosphatase [Kockovaella imperatae]ORX34560.1 Endonuclease/exonuclease/phosphatase [Kockovaella imperatae]
MSLYARTNTVGHFDIASVLRSTERVSVTLPCRVRTDGSEYHKAEAATVVSSSAGIKEAALMVIVPGTDSFETRLLHLLPITSSLKHSLNQTPPSPSTSFFHQSSRPHITLSLSNESSKFDLRISASQTVRVQTLITDIRALIDASRQQRAPHSFTHSWARLYPVIPPSLENDSDDESGSLTSRSATGESSETSLASPPSGASNSVVTPLTSLTLEPKNASTEEQYPNPFAAGFSRIGFLRKRLFASLGEWSSRTPVKIRITTYNVNDKLPPPGTKELGTLVGSGVEDVLVFGFQEVDLRSQALLISQGNVRADEWESAILAGLDSKAEGYERIAMTQYVGVMTLVFVRKTLRPHVTHVQTSERGIGLLGFGGNKAGVCVRLKIYDTTVAIVNSHLAAFATALERRRADFQVLLKGLPFPVSVGEEIVPAFEEFWSEAKDRPLGVEDSHVLFWCGDLNYRIDMEDDILRAWVGEGKRDSILEKDQLRADIASGKSFAGFREHPINFAPSFKYVHGSTTLDTRRSPAYTDRILWSTPRSEYSDTTSVACSSYDLHSILWSDHRPVSASFDVNVRVVDEERRREMYLGVERELEKLEEVYRPAIEVDETSLDFGDVRVLRRIPREIKLTNTGRVPATFNFKPPSPDKPICKAWFWPFPNHGTVKPGESVTLTITAMVDDQHAAGLSLGNAELNDVLVLRVADGKDTFITLQANFCPTILSLPLSILHLLSEPIQKLDVAQRKLLANPPVDAYQERPRGVKPVKEIWRLLEHLMANGSGRLWSGSSDEPGFLITLDKLDSGEDLPKDQGQSKGCSARNSAACLLLLLSSLPTALIPPIRLRECESARTRDEAFASLEGVPQVNTNILIGVMSVVKLCIERASAQASNSSEEKSTGTFSSEVSADDYQSLNHDTGSPDSPAPTHVLGSPMSELPTPPLDDTIPSFTITRSTPKKPAAPELTEMPLDPETLDDIVDALLPAVFGRVAFVNQVDNRRRFIKLLLEG